MKLYCAWSSFLELGQAHYKYSCIIKIVGSERIKIRQSIMSKKTTITISGHVDYSQAGDKYEKKKYYLVFFRTNGKSASDNQYNRRREHLVTELLKHNLH